MISNPRAKTMIDGDEPASPKGGDEKGVAPGEQVARPQPGTTEAANRRTFSYAQEENQSTLRGLLDFEDGNYVISADPIHTAREGGGTTISVGFPVLIVTGWVNEPALFAQKVAALLADHVE